MSELSRIYDGNKNLIVSFGGMALLMGTLPPFEFLNYLSSTYNNTIDLLFYVDLHQCWYHKGLKDITNNIDETVEYLKNKINQKKYKKIIFIGASSGGYAAILFGSLCGINNVIAFKPQTIIKQPIDKKYINLKKFINIKTKYTLICDPLNQTELHNISHCENLNNYKNIKIILISNFGIKDLRDNGEIKKIIDSIFFSNIRYIK
jgi:hypothetical protein